jgi:hypothetical protein
MSLCPWSCGCSPLDPPIIVIIPITLPLALLSPSSLSPHQTWINGSSPSRLPPVRPSTGRRCLHHAHGSPNPLVRHVPPPSPFPPPLHLIPAPHTPPTPPLPLSPCSPVVPCGERMQAHCGPVACCSMRLQVSPPSHSPHPLPRSPHTLMLTHVAGITYIGTCQKALRIAARTIVII